MVASPKSIPVLMEAIIQERAIHWQRSATLNPPSMLAWYRIFRAHYQLTMFQAIRYALWLTVDPCAGVAEWAFGGLLFARF